MGKFTVTGPDGKAYDVTAPDGATEEEIIAYVQNQIGASTSSKPESEEPGFFRDAGDVATGVLSAVPKAAGALVGLGTYVKGLNQLADPAAEALYAAGDFIDESLMSDFQLGKKAELSAALNDSLKDMPAFPEDASMGDRVAFVQDYIMNQGGAAAGYLSENPGQVINFIGETLPHIFLGGAIGKGGKAVAIGANASTKAGSLANKATGLAANRSGATYGAFGEGVLAAGDIGAQTAIEQRAQGNYDYEPERLYGLLAAPTTALIGRAGAKLSGGDFDTMAVGGALDLVEEGAKKAGLGAAAKTVTKSIASETGEEFLQSGSEQVFGNAAQEKDLYEGVGSSAVIGAATGAGLGALSGTAQAYIDSQSASEIDPDAAAARTADGLALQAQQDAEQQEANDLAVAQEQSRKEMLQRNVDLFPAREDYVAERKAQRVADLDDTTSVLHNTYRQWKMENDLLLRNGSEEDNAAKKRFLKKTTPENETEQLHAEHAQALEAFAVEREAASASQVNPAQDKSPIKLTERAGPLRPQDPGFVVTADSKIIPPSASTAAMEAQVQGELPSPLALAKDQPVQAGPLVPQLSPEITRAVEAARLKDAGKAPTVKAGANESSKPAPVAVPEADPAAMKVYSQKTATAKVEALAAAKALPDDWSSAFPELDSALNAAKFKIKPFNEALEAALNPQAVPEVTDTSVNTLAEEGTTEEAAPTITDPKALKLSEAQTRINKVLDDHFTGDKQNAIDEVFAGGEFLDTNIAKLAGVQSKQHVATSIDRFKTKFLETQGLLKPRASKAEKDAAIAAYKERLRQEADEARQAKIKASQEAATAEDTVDADISQTADTADTVDRNPNSAENLGDVSDDGEGSASIFAEVGIDSTVASVGQNNYSNTSATNTDNEITKRDSEGNQIAKSGTLSKQAYKAANAQERKAVAERNELAQKQAEAAGTEFTPEEFKPIKDLTAKQIQEFAQKQTTTDEEVAAQAAEQNAKNLQRNIDSAMQEVDARMVFSEWDALKSDSTPAFAKVSKQDRYDWMMSVLEYQESNQSPEDLQLLTADLREIEQRLEETANDAQPTESNQGSAAQSAERTDEARAPPTRSQGQGSTVDSEAGADTSQDGETASVQGAAQTAPVVGPAARNPDTIYYHGTNKSFEGMPSTSDPKFVTGQDSDYGPAAYFSNSTKAGFGQDPGGRVIEARLDTSNFVDTSVAEAIPDAKRDAVIKHLKTRRGADKKLVKVSAVADNKAEVSYTSPRRSTSEKPEAVSYTVDFSSHSKFLDTLMPALGRLRTAQNSRDTTDVRTALKSAGFTGVITDTGTTQGGSNVAVYDDAVMTPPSATPRKAPVVETKPKKKVLKKPAAATADAPNVSTRTQTKLTSQSSRATTTRMARDTFASETLDSMYFGFDTVEQGLDYIIRTGNKFEKQLSKRLKEIAALGDYAYVVVDPTKPADTLKQKDFEPVDKRISSQERRALGAGNLQFSLGEWTNSIDPPHGLYVSFGATDVDQANGVVMLNGASDNGLTNSTFLHEMLHAVTSQTIDRVQNGDIKSGPAYQLYKEIEALTQAVDRKSQGITVEQLAKMLNVSDEMAQAMKWINDDAVKLDVNEFIAYAFTDSRFQVFLNTLEVSSGKAKPASVWRRFVNAVQSFMGTALGFTSPKGETALERVMTLTDAMLDERVAMQANQVAQRRGVTPNMSATMNPKIKKQQNDWAAKFMGPKVKPFLTNARFIAKAGTRSLKFLHQIIDQSREKMPAVGRWYDGMLAAEATRNEIRRSFEDIAVRATNLDPARLDAVNDFIGKSTFFQKWAYDPEIKGRTVKIDPIMKRIFEGLNENEQQLAKDVFAHGENMRQRKIAIAKALGVDKKFFTEAALEGPYAPLKRFGNFAGELKSQQLLGAENKRDALDPKAVTKELRDKINKLKSDPAHYMISFFDTPGAAEQFVDANKNKYAFGEWSEREATVESDRISNPAVYEKVLGALQAGDKAKIDPEAKKAFQDLVKNLYFQSLDERSARLSGSRRMNRAGYDKNMMRSFLSHARAEASLISQMENGASINAALAAASPSSGARKEEIDTYNMIVKHYKDTLNQVDTPIQDRIAAANSVYMLTTSIGYHLTNATQPIMVTVPRIAGNFNDYNGTWAALFKGYGVARSIIDGSFINQVKTAATVGLVGTNQVGINIEKAPPEYRRLLEYLQLHQLLDVGMEEDLGNLDKFDFGYDSINKASDFLGGMTHRLYQVARYVEAHNRISSAIAAYDMAKKNPSAMRRMKMTPMEYATSVVQDTQGNFSRLDAPLLLKALPKVTVQYRKYQFLMAWHYTDAYKQIRFGSPEEKAVGGRILGYSLAHAGLTAGLTGVPMLGSLYWAFTTLLGDEDEPEDLERYIRSKIEDEKLADVLARGLPAFLGVDMSTKLSQGKIFLPMPYVDFEASEDGVKDVWFGLAGPAGTTAANFARAAGYMEKGDMLKAIEYSVPKGVRSATETFRLATEGFSLSNGDIVIDPREINIGSLMINAMGLPSTEINKIKWTRGQQFELMEYFNNESSRLRREYVDARRDRDRAKQKSLREEWRELQVSKERIRPFFNNERGTLKRQPVSDLMKASRRQSKREDKSRKQLTGN